MPFSATLTTVNDAVEHFSQQGFLQFLAFEPVEAGGGRAVIRLDPRPEHLNHNGTVNATVLYGLAEVAGALVSPGEFYGDAGRGFVRAAVVQPDDRIELVARRLAESGDLLGSHAAPR